jgi:hypothetical protein
MESSAVLYLCMHCILFARATRCVVKMRTLLFCALVALLALALGGHAATTVLNQVNVTVSHAIDDPVVATVHCAPGTVPARCMGSTIALAGAPTHQGLPHQPVTSVAGTLCTAIFSGYAGSPGFLYVPGYAVVVIASCQ